MEREGDRGNSFFSQGRNKMGISAYRNVSKNSRGRAEEVQRVNEPREVDRVQNVLMVMVLCSVLAEDLRR